MLYEVITVDTIQIFLHRDTLVRFMCLGNAAGAKDDARYTALVNQMSHVARERSDKGLRRSVVARKIFAHGCRHRYFGFLQGRIVMMEKLKLCRMSPEKIIGRINLGKTLAKALHDLVQVCEFRCEIGSTANNRFRGSYCFVITAEYLADHERERRRGFLCIDPGNCSRVVLLLEP